MRWLRPIANLSAAGLVLVLAACGGVLEPQATRTDEPPAIKSTVDVPVAIPTTVTAGPSTATAVPSPSQLRQSTATLSPSGNVLATPVMLKWDNVSDAPDRDLYRLAGELTLRGSQDIPRVVNPSPVAFSQGRKETFHLTDLFDLRVYQRPFELRLVSPTAYWWVEAGQNIQQRDLESAAATFEREIYPRVTSAFGKESSPGVDNDPHLNILHGNLTGVGGYFSGSDEYPQIVYPFSNQRESIYINTSSLRVGTSGYLAVLAHELQHAVHWNADRSEDTWVNEGLSELASSIAGYQPDSFSRYLLSPKTSLVNWPLDSRQTAPHYGGSYLFFQYLSEHYGNPGNLRPVVSEPEDSTKGIDAYLKALGSKAIFREVFRDWVVANLLDLDNSKYGYKALAVQASAQHVLDASSRARELKSELPQYAVEYIELRSSKEPLRIRFRGAAEGSLLPVAVGEPGCWWSNSGDSIDSTLTRAVDLTGLKQATLKYQVWFQTEKGWDYGYVQISIDGGKSWQIIETPNTSAENPIGNSFGPGYTGNSSGWIAESIDLSPYAGTSILVRFQYITDDAINGAGFCWRRMSVAEAGIQETVQGWQPGGFVLIDNRVQQDYIVQVIEVGKETKVSLMALDSSNSGEFVIMDPKELDRLVVAVAALAPKTLRPAPYTMTVEPAV